MIRGARAASVSAVLAAALLLGAGAASGHSATAQAAPAAPRTHVLVVTGLGGAPEYSEQFRTEAEALLDALDSRLGVRENVAWLAEDEALSPRVAGRASLEAVEREVLGMANRAGPSDVALILLLGHGSGRGQESRFSLPGPDLSGEALSMWLHAFPTQTVAVVNAASASGGFVPALAGERRIVVTATRSPRERERTHFGGFFINAFALDEADVDKDERVSLLEAFRYATGEVRRRYERDNEMLTEHALLDDDGDGEGSLEPSPDGPDGTLASRFFLAQAPVAMAGAAADDPAVAALLARKREVEDGIAALRARRDEMEEEDYDAQLETLLVELARLNRAIRDGGSGPCA
ncbi:hypothetical protein [Candidatus Palauibacter soopunensis]|uniref:hypothetical protein n=1 Tax=Candidatus Palauibacter soopunensis TaxID=3056739 RepID=UPI00238869F1|nr:hypothetical protein [Candidatus Palauibacter soopunensis]MDE2878147.1 hypothetical protein [Candidatus Palauibacter soopunensis]